MSRRPSRPSRPAPLVTALTLLAGLPAAAVTALAAVSGPASAAAPEEPRVISTGVDAWDDVRVYRRVAGLGRSDRRSIDLRRVTVVERTDDAHRLTVRVARLAPTDADFEQMVFFRFDDPATGDRYHVGFSQTGVGGWAHHETADGSGGASCELDGVRRRPARGTLSVVVPETCTAPAGSAVRVTSATGFLNTDADLWSRDRQRALDLG